MVSIFDVLQLFFAFRGVVIADAQENEVIIYADLGIVVIFL